MASRDESVPPQSELNIISFEDFERMLSENKIVQQYHEHLNQVNICIIMFEELETNRSYWEVFSDWANGGRDKIDSENLMKNLKELKKELLAGISIYIKLLARKEEFKKYFQTMNMINFECIVGVGTKFSFIPLENNAANHGSSGKGVHKVSYFEKSVTPEFFKVKEEKRNLKYQAIQKFQDILNAKLLSEVRNKNKDMKKINETIYETLHKREFIVYLANSFYFKSKDKALAEITDNELDLTVELCETLSKREAKKACKSYFKHEFNCSNEEVEEILNEIQSSKE